MEHKNHENHHAHHDHSAHKNHQDHHSQAGHGHGGHDHGSMIEDFKRRFYICLLISIPVLVLSPMIQGFFGFEFTFIGASYVSATLSSFIFFYGGWPFLKGLKDELSKGGPGMMTLIAIAITVAWAYSTAVVFGLSGKVFYWELVTLIDIMLLGHWIEMKSVMGASKALEKLAELMPSEAHLVTEDGVKDIKLNEIHKGDIILIKPGEKIPADGLIVEGESELDESALTGESKPVSKTIDDQVIGGAINIDGSLKVKVNTAGEDSYLNKVIKLVKEAQQTKSKTQNLADKAAGALAYVAIIGGLTTLIYWWFFSDQDFNFALERMVTVMIITCPHALGLAVPLVSAISTTYSAKNGLLIRNRTAFENSRKITAIVFDKTGTLTKGEFGVKEICVMDSNIDKNELLTVAAAIEQESEHPIAKGIVRHAKKQKLNLPSISSFKAEKGKGVEALIDDIQFKIVSPGYLKEVGLEIPNEAFDNSSETVVFILKENTLAGYLKLTDSIRDESQDAIHLLQKKGIKTYMATGDNSQTAKSVSDQLGLDGYYSEVLPHQKSEIITELQQKGNFVAMTGDGVNDAPALAKADVGIAIGSGTDVAAETADIILTESSPKDITRLIEFGQATYRKMIQNLVWATGYNVVAIPLAAGTLFNQGIMISPAVGAALMSLSTIVCAVNAQLLKKQISNKEG
ncbi:ATPase [Roseivirga seohaensis]|uniref:ATPase n=1 Tax=Roseivirga seohaensis TaxID=1914963 RepID=A0A150Y3M3_9BACT|nr:copper-translocating P-type ATPase [Roseivirga seohaensis]KYG85587.1 ATPase [Roseivirga seohaensis]